MLLFNLRKDKIEYKIYPMTDKLDENDRSMDEYCCQVFLHSFQIDLARGTFYFRALQRNYLKFGLKKSRDFSVWTHAESRYLVQPNLKIVIF